MTLIETLIYFGLLTLLITGVIGSSLSINMNAVSSQESVRAAREGDFIVHVIDNLASFHHILPLAPGGQENILEVTESSQSLIKTSIYYEAGKLWLRHEGEPAVPLSADGSVISDFQVRQTEDKQLVTIEFRIHRQLYTIVRAINS